MVIKGKGRKKEGVIYTTHEKNMYCQAALYSTFHIYTEAIEAPTAYVPAHSLKIDLRKGFFGLAC